MAHMSLLDRKIYLSRNTRCTYMNRTFIDLIRERVKTQDEL